LFDFAFIQLRLNEHSRHSVDKELFAALGDAKATEFWQQKRDLLIDQQRAMRSKLVEEKRALRIAQAKETVANFCTLSACIIVGVCYI
jgi:hypothetical protein